MACTAFVCGIMGAHMANPSPKPLPSNVGKVYKTHKKINPKAEIFTQFFLVPTSPTFMNARGSAIRAGYSEHYADSITVQRPKWYVDITESADYRRAQMLDIAERNLLDSVASNSDDREDKKIRHDATKFVTERLGKDKYSTRQEVTGAGGRRLFTNENRTDALVPVSNLFKGVQKAPTTPQPGE